jgi:hypothetical protein
MHILRNMIFNEIKLAGNMSVRGLFQNIIALINTIITNTFTKNKKNKSITARIRKTIFKIKLPKKVIEITKISAKFINIIALRRNPNIVYENFIEKNPILSKIIITKIIPNEDKSSYEAAMTNSKIS